MRITSRSASRAGEGDADGESGGHRLPHHLLLHAQLRRSCGTKRKCPAEAAQARPRPSRRSRSRWTPSRTSPRRPAGGQPRHALESLLRDQLAGKTKPEECEVRFKCDKNQKYKAYHPVYEAIANAGGVISIIHDVK